MLMVGGCELRAQAFTAIGQGVLGDSKWRGNVGSCGRRCQSGSG